MTMNELVTWFQENYPENVSQMRESDHHFEYPEGAFSLNPYHLEGMCGPTP